MDQPSTIEIDDDRDILPEDKKYLFTILGIHRNEISLHLWKLFLGFDPLLYQDHPTEVSILSITRLDSWIATVVDLLVNVEKRGGARQRDYNNLFHKHFVLATYQLISNIYDFVYFWVPEELSLDNTIGTNNRNHILSMDREATLVLYSPSTSIYYIALQATWFSKYISPNVGIIHDCFIAKISEDWKDITRLARDDVHEMESTSFQVNSPVPSTDNSASNNSSQSKSFTTDHENYEEEIDDPSALEPTVVPPLQT